MTEPPEPPPRVRPAWGPIVALCLAIVYLMGFAACVVAVWARGWLR